MYIMWISPRIESLADDTLTHHIFSIDSILQLGRLQDPTPELPLKVSQGDNRPLSSFKQFLVDYTADTLQHMTNEVPPL